MSAAFATSNTAIGRDAVHVGGLQGEKIGIRYFVAYPAGVGEGGGGTGTALVLVPSVRWSRHRAGHRLWSGQGTRQSRSSKMPSIVLRKPVVQGGLDMQTVRRFAAAGIALSIVTSKRCSETPTQRVR